MFSSLSYSSFWLQAKSFLVKDEAKRTLDNFCHWAYSKTPRRHSNPERHDIAMYLTRYDIGPAGKSSHTV